MRIRNQLKTLIRKSSLISQPSRKLTVVASQPRGQAKITYELGVKNFSKTHLAAPITVPMNSSLTGFVLRLSFQLN